MQQTGQNAEALPRILVVEDDFLVRLTLVEALADEAFFIIEAEDGDVALAALHADDSIALLITDLHLPGRVAGQALVAAMREFRPGLPVIYLTGRPDLVAPDRDAGEILIGKPYLASEVSAAARELLGI